MKEPSSTSIVSVGVGEGYNDSSVIALFTSKSDRNVKALTIFLPFN